MLGEVAGVGEQGGILRELGVDPLEILLQLLKRGLELAGVGRLVGDIAGDDHLRVAINDRLGVEALLESPVGGLHDPRVRVGKVALRRRLRRRRLIIGIGLARLAPLGTHLRLAGTFALLLLGLERRLGLPDPAKAGLAAGEL